MKTQDIKNIATALKDIREAAKKKEEGMDYNPAKGGYNQPKGKPPVGTGVGTREAMKPEVKKALAKSSAASEKGKKAVTLPKAPFKMEGAIEVNELSNKTLTNYAKYSDNDIHKRRANRPKGAGDESDPKIAQRVKMNALAHKKGAFKKEDNSNDVSDDGEGLDKVQPKAVKKKFKDRKDKDIDNDGNVDSSDKFLHKRRKAVSKAMASKKKPSVEKDADVEVQEAATATHKPNNGSDSEQGLSPNAKKMMAMKTDAPEAHHITKVAPKTFAAMRASGKKAAMRNNDNAQGDKTPPKNDGK